MSAKTTIHLSSVLWNNEQENPMVILEDSEGRGFALPVDVSEAVRLIPALRGDWPQTPTAETSLAQLFKQLKARPIEVNLYAASQSCVFVCLVYTHGLSTSKVELSLSDAICFSLRYSCPMTISETLWKALTSPRLEPPARADTPGFFIISPPAPTAEKAV